jgi:hypothetical protein
MPHLKTERHEDSWRVFISRLRRQDYAGATILPPLVVFSHLGLIPCNSGQIKADGSNPSAFVYRTKHLLPQYSSGSRKVVADRSASVITQILSLARVV